MSYNPYNPYNPYQTAYNQMNGYNQQNGYYQQNPRDGIIRVTGMEGAKAYQMPPNSREALFDDTDDIVFIKVTDGGGFPTLKAARLEWIGNLEKQAQSPEYLTREEFARWREEFENGQHVIRQRRSRVAENEQAAAEECGS